jgi:hypothetical protein
MPAPYALSDSELLAQCRIDTFRAGGAGGQHVNKTDSAVRLTHLASGTTAQSQNERDRLRNQTDALRHLRLRMALTMRGLAEVGWLDRYRQGRQLRLGPRAQDYHLVVATVLDVLERHVGGLSTTAQELNISASQIAKLLTADKEVHAATNALRARHGLGGIHA